jgi:hypothetical protein
MVWHHKSNSSITCDVILELYNKQTKGTPYEKYWSSIVLRVVKWNNGIPRLEKRGMGDKPSDSKCLGLELDDMKYVNEKIADVFEALLPTDKDVSIEGGTSASRGAA